MRFVHLDSVDSTNEQAKRLLAGAAPELPACVIARAQTAGRGTRGRAWSSPRDAGVYLSVVDRPLEHGLDPRAPASVLYTLAAGVACVEAIASTTGVRIQLKAVNDLWADGRKLGGILTEVVVERGAIASTVVGVGVNLHHAPRAIEPGAARPVCLEELRPAAPGGALDRAAIARAIAHRILAWSRVAAEGDAVAVRRAWSEYAVPGSSVPQ